MILINSACWNTGREVFMKSYYLLKLNILFMPLQQRVECPDIPQDAQVWLCRETIESDAAGGRGSYTNSTCKCMVQSGCGVYIYTSASLSIFFFFFFHILMDWLISMVLLTSIYETRVDPRYRKHILSSKTSLRNIRWLAWSWMGRLCVACTWGTLMMLKRCFSRH